MLDITWAKILEKITPYVFKIHTPRGTGTGFQISYSKKSNMCGIATALHVIEHAHEWEDPIRIHHHESKKTIILRHAERAIFSNQKKDLAIILFNIENVDLPIKSDALELIEEGKRLKQGIQVGWCGFPAVAPNDLCFFAGHVSSYLISEESYLVDGVAINGISGGPAFYGTSENNFYVCGVVTAYIPNRATGESLPGVCLIRSVKAYQVILKKLESLEDAKKQAIKETKQESNIKPEKDKDVIKEKKAVKKKASSKKIKVINKSHKS